MERFKHGRLAMAVQRYGHGPQHVIAFPGFGRSGQDFTVYEDTLGATCTLHAFDLPFHGHSPGFEVDRPLTPQELSAFFRAYSARSRLTKPHVLGYSLGGRFALSLVEQMPDMLGMAFLAAPDGLVARPWYRGLANYRLGRWLYRRFIDHPGTVHGLAHLLHRTGLISSKMHRFLIDSSATTAQRRLLHNVWTGFRLLEPDLARVARQARQHQLTLHLLLGEHDRVIPPQQARTLKHFGPDVVQTHILPTGHRLIGPNTADLLRRLIGEQQEQLAENKKGPLPRPPQDQ